MSTTALIPIPSLGRQVNAFLVSKGRPRLPLPEVCGYVPLAELVYDYLSPPAAPVLPPASSGRRAMDCKSSSSVSVLSRGLQEQAITRRLPLCPGPLADGSVESSNRATGSSVETSRRGAAGRREEKEDLVLYEVQKHAATGREPRGRDLVDMPIWGQDEASDALGGGAMLDPFAVD